MAYTPPTTRSNGYTVGNTIWNAEHVENIALLASALKVSGGYVSRSGTNLIFLPDAGRYVLLYVDNVWQPYLIPTAGITIACTGLTASTVFFLYVKVVLGVLTLEFATTAPTTQDAIQVKTGATSSTLLAVCYANAAGAITTYVEDPATQFICNVYNKRRVTLYKLEATNSWTYSVAAYRAANGSNANRVEFVTDGTQAISAAVQCLSNSASNFTHYGIGLDSVTVNSARTMTLNTSAINVSGSANYSGQPASGYHYLQWLEYSVGGAAANFYGDNGTTQLQSGITAEGNF